MNKGLILAALTIQNAIVTIAMRYSRIRPGDKFSPTTVVVSIEIVKLFTSFAIVYLESAPKKFMEILSSISQPDMLVQMAIPSFVYLAQNNLLYIAATHLDTSFFQVTFQSRILATAVFSRIMLSKKLGVVQWFALLLLMTGIVTVNLSVLEETGDSGVTKTNSIIGITAAFLAAGCSGFAGVYLESKFKSSACSLWVRNYQLALVSVPLGFMMCILDDKQPLRLGFFYGYDLFVVCLILLQSMGGFLVAVVIKYADNILKGFSTSLTICITCVASHFLFNVHLNWLFGLGTIIVITSTFIYSKTGTPVSVTQPKEVAYTELDLEKSSSSEPSLIWRA